MTLTAMILYVNGRENHFYDKIAPPLDVLGGLDFIKLTRTRVVLKFLTAHEILWVHRF
jgi:hypothetical protein